MSIAETSAEDALVALHTSLDERRRPEEVAHLVLRVVGGQLGLRDRMALGRAARAASRWNGWSSMSADFARPVGGARQIDAAARLFELPRDGIDPDDPVSLLDFSVRLSESLGAVDPARLDFLRDRLNREGRAAAGIELSKRQYNRRFRVTQRLSAKADRLAVEQTKRHLTMVARAGFAGSIERDAFLADRWAGCFVAYLTAKRKLRREFTLSGRDNPYDGIADLLFKHCAANPATDWWMIAQAHPTPAVLARLTDAQRGELLGRWWATMCQVASLLKRVWVASEFDRATMIVRRGNDSSTWNLLCGAYNAARAAWIATLDASGSLGLLEASCPGKAMMLIAADLAAWHRSTGGGLHPDVGVWARLPLPWDVLDGTTACTRTDVETACADGGVDPVTSGWAGPKPLSAVGVFRPTPELVHGVSIVDPLWASMLRAGGAFSGKTIKGGLEQSLIPGDVVVSELPERAGHVEP
ncbi:hypothetical protein [Verrucosispora sp. WMMD573]|uniref:hypothetical protein n=1 Tax=Verrucosispora sp. WMMD573 TaxID=3015149 RepID=UPI00248ADAB5|nr:hypothetical protein [Verrucosispora sp. WMMD573]WBB52389.1 hypothetical protein O7601_17515 [Verrucosispora sp. WMMD573]